MLSEGSSADSAAPRKTIFRCPSKKPCGAALIDSAPGRIKNTQAVIKHLGDMVIKKMGGIDFTYPAQRKSHLRQGQTINPTTLRRCIENSGADVARQAIAGNLRQTAGGRQPIRAA